MKLAIKLKTLFFLLSFFALANFSYAQNSISGTVRYSDNLQVVTAGTVNAYDLTGTFAGSGNINADGTYAITGLGGVQYDVIGFPNIEPDFPPTGFPNTINPAQIQPILAIGQVINKDVYVQRLSTGGGNKPKGSMSGNVTQNNVPLKDAVVYITSGNDVYGFGVTNSTGDYVINNIPIGDYIIVAHRIGDNSASVKLTLTTGGAENINFNVKPVNNGKNIVSVNPVEYKLSQNYPNPFNPSTIIQYDVPKEGNVSLKIYNSLGELVKSLVNADQKAGAYSVTFDGASLSSGIYFYTLEASGFVDTKRMVLIK